MPSPQIVFTSYAIIGLTLLILAASVAIYLLRLPEKSRATWALILFFFMVALSGTATILTNALYNWGDLFAPWQDFFILAGGVALTYFAYSLPRYEPSREARAVLLLMSSIALLALAYTITFDYLLLFQPTPELNESDLYYLLLPLGTLFIVLIFLRRSAQLSKRAGSNMSSFWRRLVHPTGEDARALRNLALALSLAFLPAVQTLVSFPYPYGFIMANIGSILAIIAIALVYFNYAPEVNSFLAKLVGITLASVLFIVAVTGSIDIYLVDGLIYDLGATGAAKSLYLSEIVSSWLLLILAASAFVLFLFPLFFRRVLVQPIENLLLGINRVNKGNLDTFVPICFDDEIGSLTDSFNKLTQSLQVSKLQQEQLFERLQLSYEELEERVADRTRELSAFTDLTMLPGNYENFTDILQPALNRIMEIGLCQALCVHLLAEDQQSMALVAQRNLPQTVAKKLEYVPASLLFTNLNEQAEDPVLSSPQIDRPDLPHELKIQEYQSYLGSPLVAGTQVLGWLSCYRRLEDGFTIGEISLLVALARQMGLIVENNRLRQRIRNVAVYKERQRLARDLHDSVTQLVYSMTLFTQSAQQAVEDGDTKRLSDNLEHLAGASIQALREMRSMLFELQPPVLEKEGLAKALNARFDMVERRVGIRVKAGVDTPIESETIERELYYVAIEALNNSLKHAEANEVTVKITSENGCFRLLIADNGRGFILSQESAGLGIDNMRQRINNLGGEFLMNSQIDQGTIIIATIPNSM
jgi:signal transduction histidine kinase